MHILVYFSEICNLSTSYGFCSVTSLHLQVEVLELTMDHVQKEAASMESERDEAMQKMSVCEPRFDEFQVGIFVVITVFIRIQTPSRIGTPPPPFSGLVH